MATIEIKYLGNKVDTINNGFFNALGKEALRNEYISKVQNKIKNLEDIEKVIEEIKTIEDENNIITPNTVFIVTLKTKKNYLSNNFKLISKDEFARLNFVPYIKFDKSNCDTSKEEQRVNKILKYKSSDEAIEFINEYIEKPPKSFKNISDKPNKLFLCCFNKRKVFDVNLNS
jgi:folate-dependent tRNA-U54 methylase TrmFO/GidA